MPIVKSCCGACSLLRGGKVLSWVEIVLNVISIVFTGIVLGKDDQYYINTHKTNIMKQQKIESDKDPYRIFDTFDQESYANDVHMIRLTLLVYIILKVVVIVASVILYVAVVKRKRLLIVPYLMVAMLNILFFVYANIRMLLLIGNLGEFMFWVVLTVALGENKTSTNYTYTYIINGKQYQN